MFTTTARWHEVPAPVAAINPDDTATMLVASLGRPNTVLFLGFGNERRAMQRIIRSLKDRGVTDIAVVAALPYWSVLPREDLLMRLATLGPLAAASYVRSVFDRNVVHVIAESQAAPGVAEAVAKSPATFGGRLAFVGPHGIVRLTRRQLIARLAATAMRTERTRTNIGAVRMVQDRVKRNGAQLSFGLQADMLPALARISHELAAGVRIFSGDDDMLFPPSEMVARLKQVQLQHLLQEIPGGHASPATKDGMEQLIRALDWCRSSTNAVN